MRLTEGTTLEITGSADAIILRKAHRPRRPIRKIADGIKRSTYQRRRRELMTDRPVGKEIW
jgi:antitoxin component of MazEF toxin-antitoxin module